MNKKGFAIIPVVTITTFALAVILTFYFVNQPSVTPQTDPPPRKTFVSFLRDNQLWILDLSNKTETQIAPSEIRVGQNYGWTPDGKYTLYKAAYTNQLFSFSPELNTEYTLYPRSDDNPSNLTSIVSITNEKIWFVERVVVNSNSEIALFSVAPDGSSLTQEAETHVFEGSVCPIGVNKDYSKFYYSIAGQAFCGGVYTFDLTTKEITQVFPKTISSQHIAPLANDQLFEEYSATVYSITQSPPTTEYSVPNTGQFFSFAGKKYTEHYISVTADSTLRLHNLSSNTVEELPTAINSNIGISSLNADKSIVVQHSYDNQQIIVSNYESGHIFYENTDTYDDIHIQGVHNIARY